MDELRSAGLKVSLKEHLMLLDALNEEVIEFEFDPFSKVLEAYVSKPIIIESFATNSSHTKF